MPSPFSWQTTLDSGVVLGFTGKSFGSLATPAAESGVDSSLHRRRAELNAYAGARGYQPVLFMKQTHSCTVIDRSNGTQLPPAGFDAHYSSPAASSLGVLTADCLPILLAGTGHQGAPVIAAIHAGRVGLLAGIIQETAQRLRPHWSSTPLAVIGPAICGRCYEVPESMRDAATSRLARIGSTTRWGTPALDLPAAAETLLRDADYRIHRTEICTLEDPAFYSYRGGDKTDRNAGIILTPVAADPKE